MVYGKLWESCPQQYGDQFPSREMKQMGKRDTEINRVEIQTQGMATMSSPQFLSPKH